MSFLSDEHVIEINDQQEMVGILGRNDEFLRLIDASFDATVMARGNKIIFSGSEEENQKLEQPMMCVTAFIWCRAARWLSCTVCMRKR